MAAVATPTWNLGFLSILQDQAGFLGGYLVTNQWGRPLEFRLSTAVQPNRVQQILYGETLLPYVCGELIGKTIFEKANVQPQAIVTDREPALELRRHVPVPVAYLKMAASKPIADCRLQIADLKPAAGNLQSAICNLQSPRRPRATEFPDWITHASFSEDAAVFRELGEKLGGSFDFAEPFARIREAVAEARKLGVTSRA